MKVAVLFVWLTIGLSISLLLAFPVYPHGGGLDSYGCHNNRKAGGYHCHRGPLAGQSFSSKDEMLQRLKGEKTADRSLDKPPPSRRPR